MKPKPALLSPLIRSDVQGLILARLFLNPTLEHSITELAEFSITSVPTAMREVDRLIESEFVTSRAVGRVKLIRANQNHTLFSSVFQLIAHSYGPVAALPQVLSGIFGLQEAHIHGDWAARLNQIPGPIPQSIDLLLVGNMNRIDAAKAIAPVEKIVGSTFNLQFASEWDWRRASTDFLARVQAGALKKVWPEQAPEPHLS